MSKDSEKPVFEVRARGIKAAVWSKQKESKTGRTYTEYSIQITKSYKDESGNWHTTNYYFEKDLPHLMLVANRAFEYVALHETSNDGE